MDYSAQRTNAILPALVRLACWDCWVFFFVCLSFCVCLFFFSGSQRAPLDPPCSHGNTGRHWQDGCASDAGPDGSQWGERSGNGISGSAAGPFTGGWGKKRRPPPGSGRGHLLFSTSRLIHNRAGLMNETQVSLAVNSPLCPLQTEGWGNYLSSRGFYTIKSNESRRLSAVFILSGSAQGRGDYCRGWCWMRHCKQTCLCSHWQHYVWHAIVTDIDFCPHLFFSLEKIISVLTSHFNLLYLREI